MGEEVAHCGAMSAGRDAPAAGRYSSLIEDEVFGGRHSKRVELLQAMPALVLLVD